MKTEKGVIITAYKSKLNPRYAALKRKKNWEGWELPKGHLEEEDYQKTVKLELKEEAGIAEDQVQKIEDLEKTITWKFDEDGERIKRKYKVFLVKVGEDAEIDVNGNPHDEHSQGFFFRKRDLESLLTYDNHKEVLQKASEEVDE